MGLSPDLATLIERICQADPVAEQTVWDHYYVRLRAFARTKLQGMPLRVVDEEDLLQDVFIQFFAGIRTGKLVVLDSHDDFWGILALIAARTAANLRKQSRRLKRGAGKVRGDSVFNNTGDLDATGGLDEVASDGIGPADTVAAAESLRLLFDRVDDPVERLVAWWRFEGRTVPEIADHLDCSISSVERKLRNLREQLGPAAGDIC